MIRNLIKTNKTITYPFISKYYNRCLFSTNNIINNNNNNNTIKNNNQQSQIKPNIDNNINNNTNNNTNNNIENDKENDNKTEIKGNYVKKEILDMIEEDLFENKKQIESIMKMTEFKAKKDDVWLNNILNFSPYFRMVGINKKILNPIEKYCFQKPQQYKYSYLLSDKWIDSHLIGYQVQLQLKQFFNQLNQRDINKLKDSTSPWLFKMLSSLITNLSTYDKNETKFFFNINHINSIERGYIQRSADKLYITFHFILDGNLGVNDYSTDVTNNFKCSVVFESLIPQSKRTSDFKWKIDFIDPSVLSIISVESLMPMLK